MPYFRVNIDGGFSTVAEKWNTGFAVLVDGPAPSQVAVDAWANSAMNYLSSAASELIAIKGRLSTVGTIDRVRVYYYNTPGTPAVLSGTSVAASVSGQGSVALPLQCTTVVSLRTALPGGSYRGRMYFPKVTNGPGSSFKDSGINQSVADNFKLILRTIAETAPSTSAGRVAVASVSKGVVTPVTSVRVGDVIDTQRRRTDALSEVYYTSAI